MIIFGTLGRSFIGRIDPRVRVLAAVLFSIVVVLCRGYGVLATALAATVLLAVVARVGAGQALRRLTELNVFMLLVAVSLPLFIPGTPVFHIGALSWSSEGLWRAGLIAARANAIMIAMTALLATMEPAHLGFALSHLGCPDKLVHVLLFMVRYVEVVHVEYHRLRDAMRLRGFRPRFNRHTLRSLGYLTGMLLVRSLERGERIMQAMKCRGFRGRFYVLDPLKICGRDVGFAAASAALAAFLVWMEWQ
ncbi:MAG: cobalt ECF transporter T component CbiQ [Planctomycetes bacterium]|nr:cobalt ECF transporter T component CbiQ [Planctomycetota bacterium]